MDKEELVHIYPGIFLSHKREQNKAICSNMDGQDDYHAKLSISEKDTYHMISPTCRIFKKNDTNKCIFAKQEQTYRQKTILWLPKGWGKGIN